MDRGVPIDVPRVNRFGIDVLRDQEKEGRKDLKVKKKIL